MGHGARYTTAQMIEALQAAAVDGTLSRPVYEASGARPDARTISRRFGSWPNALKTAGLKGVPRGRPKGSKASTRRGGWTAKPIGRGRKRDRHMLFTPAEYQKRVALVRRARRGKRVMALEAAGCKVYTDEERERFAEHHQLPVAAWEG